MIDHEGSCTFYASSSSMFMVGIDKLYRKRPNNLGKIIGANLSSNCAGGNLSKIFDCIASKRGWSTPVHISDSFSDITAIVTHARSLASITVNSSYQIMLKYTDSLKSTHDPFMITCNHDSLPMPAHSKKISRCKTSDHDYWTTFDTLVLTSVHRGPSMITLVH